MVDVPTRAEFDTLTARVAALEHTSPPSTGISVDGAKVTGPGQVLVTDDGTSWQLSGPTDNMQVQFRPKDGTLWVAAGNTSKVALLEKWKSDIYQSSPNSSSLSTPGWWKGMMASATSFGSWTDYPGDPSIAVIPPTGTFTVDVHGFKDGTGKAWRARGLNGGVQDALDGFGNVFKQFPAMSIYRLNTGSGNSDASIADVVQKYTSHGCVVLIEDHSGNTRDTVWYTRMATTYRGNPLVMLGVPNEPSGDVQNDQINIINTIKSAGYKGLIGLQCGGGWKYDFIDGVIQSVGKDQLFLTPHIYYNGTDPNGGQNYMDSDIKGANDRGLWCVFTEFGDGMDGYTRNPYGLKLVDSVIAGEKANKCGALFWAMDNDNHADGCCSAFATRDGATLTSTGKSPLKAWLT